MIEPAQRQTHWQSTMGNAVAVLGLLAVLALATSLFADWLPARIFLGIPVAFYLAAQGAFLIMIILVFWSAGQQEKTDRQHGASEEL